MGVVVLLFGNSCWTTDCRSSMPLQLVWAMEPSCVVVVAAAGCRPWMSGCLAAVIRVLFWQTRVSLVAELHRALCENPAGPRAARTREPVAAVRTRKTGQLFCPIPLVVVYDRVFYACSNRDAGIPHCNSARVLGSDCSDAVLTAFWMMNRSPCHKLYT